MVLELESVDVETFAVDDAFPPVPDNLQRPGKNVFCNLFYA